VHAVFKSLSPGLTGGSWKENAAAVPARVDASHAAIFIRFVIS
jgi:hypothetical protein